jgi:hypothetical protein
MEKASSATKDADQLVRWQAWRDSSFAIQGLGVVLSLLPFVIGMGLTSSGRELKSGVSWALFIITGLGVVVFVGGVSLWLISLLAYKTQIRKVIESSRGAVAESLIQRVQNKDFGRNQAVITILGDLGDRNATLSLIETLKDNDAGVRKKSARALGNIKDERAGEVLWAALKYDKVDEVQSQAAVALDKLNWKPAANAEEAYFFIWNKRWAGVEKLGEAAIEPLIQSLRVGDGYTRLMAAQTLGKLGDKRAVSPLTEALKDEDKNVRSSAKSALNKIKRKT